MRADPATGEFVPPADARHPLLYRPRHGDLGMPEVHMVSGHELLDRVTPGTLSTDHEADLRGFYAMKRFRPIEVESRLYLDVRGHGNEARFVARFLDVWTAIPSGDRASILEHWREHERIPGVLGIPISLENRSDMLQSQMSGVCEGPGTALVFFAPVVDRLPEQHAAALVAHELAHVLQASLGTLTVASCPEWLTDEMADSLAGDYGMTADLVKAKWTNEVDQNEPQADAIAVRWGFDAPAMTSWIESHIDWQDLG